MAAYRKILVAVDGSPAAGKGLREAIRLAEEGAGVLVILHVVDESQIYYAMEGAGLFMDVHKRLREESRRILERARTVAARRRLEPTMVMRETAGGSVARAIVQEARKQRADLIILGTHGRRGVRRLVMGSDAEEVVRGAPVPVLLVRAGQ